MVHLKSRFLSVTLFILTLFPCNAQLADTTNYNLKDIQLRQTNFNKISMISLNSWAVVNIGYGTIASFNSGGEAKYFHQMNAIWNTVNLAIGIPGIIGAYKKRDQMGFEELYKTQQKMQAIYLFNAGLDVGYMMAGLSARLYGRTLTGTDAIRFKGYGSSLIMQGGYLFVHDLISFYLLKSNKSLFDKEWGRVRFIGTGAVLEFK